MGAEGEVERIKWTVADYHRMAEVGLLAPDARVELIDGYATRAPVPEDVLLAIEVAQSSLRFDLRVKVPLYARAKLHEVWIIDGEAERLHAFDQLVDGAYARARELAAGDRISISALPTIGIDVAELFNWSGR